MEVVHLNDLPGFGDLALTIGFTADLTARHAPTPEWDALTAALVAEHTQTELADLLVAACTLIARASTPISVDIDPEGARRYTPPRRRGPIL